MRQEEPTAITAIFDEAIALTDEKVVGIDLAGPEEDGYVPDLAASYQVFLKNQSVQLTLHAANAAVAKHLSSHRSGAQRIGHGIALKGDPTAQAFVREQKIAVSKAGPTSNVHTRAIPTYSAYPLREWLKAKVPFCLNTDNRNGLKHDIDQ